MAIINATPNTADEIKKFQLDCLILKIDVKATENSITEMTINSCPNSNPILKEKRGSITDWSFPSNCFRKVENPSP